MNITLICGSIEGIRVNPQGYRQTIEVQVNDLEIETVLEQIDRKKIEAHLAGLDQSTSDDEATMDLERLNDARKYVPAVELLKAG